MAILDINNRTENWKTALYFSPLFNGRSASLAERLGKESHLDPATVKIELFWRGMRDLLYQTAVKRRSMQQTFADIYVRLFPNLREVIQDFGEFRELQTDNYVADTDAQLTNLTNNLANTEIDVVLESPSCLFIGEAKHEMSFGADGALVLVHQLVRQYVTARILVEYLPGQSKKKVVPFVVCDDAANIMNSSQVRFMIGQGWLEETNILPWHEINNEIQEATNPLEEAINADERIMDVEEFLLDVGLDHLREIGVLMFVTQELKGESVGPLIQLMRDRRVEKIVNASSTWYLTSNGEFFNSNSRDRIDRGPINQLDDLGNVFLGRNTSINPYYINPH